MTRQWKRNVDSIAGVGTVYQRAKQSPLMSRAITRRKRQWTEAGIHLEGDALGMVTGGAGS